LHRLLGGRRKIPKPKLGFSSAFLKQFSFYSIAFCNHITALQWALVESKNEGGVQRGPRQKLTGPDTLRAYMIGSAWFWRDNYEKQGSLEPGRIYISRLSNAQRSK
jgi:hypothetical protein